MGNGDKVLKNNYESPRWSNELLDCSMPMTFDTYSKCAYNCQYCFSYFQKVHNVIGYLGGEVRCANTDKIIKLFESVLNGNYDKLSDEQKQFIPYILDRRIMQWGGLADEFDEYERRFGVTLELLKFFDKIDYPLSFSTKAAWWTEDTRYMNLFKKHAHNWHVKISIITNDDDKARRIEKGCPASSERLKAIKNLADIGIHVTLRLRPYIIGLSDDYEELIKRAAQAGADSVTTEFFCMESRADEQTKARYKEISRVIGYDIYTFYMKESRQNGYKRLNKAIKAPIIANMRKITHELGLRFYVSDMYCRECNDAVNCCGVPPEWQASQLGHIGNAICIARKNGRVYWSDIKPQVEKYFNSFEWHKAAGYNSNSNRARAVNYNKSMAQYIHENWNNVKSAKSPARGYGGVLTPCGVDDNNDVIYKYTPQIKEVKDKDYEEKRATAD